MTSATWSTSTQAAPGGLKSLLPAKFAPLAAIALAHALVFYAFYSGMLHKVAQVALPHEVFVTFVAPPAPPPAALPKMAPLAAPTMPQIQPLPPVPVTVENAITPPPAAAVPAERVSAAPAPVSAPAAPAPVSAPRLLSSGVEYVQAPQLVYPAASKRLNEQGKVVLRVLVNEKGQPAQVTVHTSSGFPRLDEAGRQATLRAVFKPHLDDGRAIAVYVDVLLNFQLTN
jgi:protein TonB